MARWRPFTAILATIITLSFFAAGAHAQAPAAPHGGFHAGRIHHSVIHFGITRTGKVVNLDHMRPMIVGSGCGSSGCTACPTGSYSYTDPSGYTDPYELPPNDTTDTITPSMDPYTQSGCGTSGPTITCDTATSCTPIPPGCTVDDTTGSCDTTAVDTSSSTSTTTSTTSGTYATTQRSSHYGKWCYHDFLGAHCDTIQAEITFYWNWNGLLAWSNENPYCSEYTDNTHYAKKTWDGITRPNPGLVTGGCNVEYGATIFGLDYKWDEVKLRVYARANGSSEYDWYTG